MPRAVCILVLLAFVAPAAGFIAPIRPAARTVAVPRVVSPVTFKAAVPIVGPVKTIEIAFVQAVAAVTVHSRALFAYARAYVLSVAFFFESLVPPLGDGIVDLYYVWEGPAVRKVKSMSSFFAKGNAVMPHREDLEFVWRPE